MNTSCIHVTRNKQLITVADLDIDRLKEILRKIELQAHKGLSISNYCQVEDPISYQEELLYGNDVRAMLGYDTYNEALNNKLASQVL